jgi:hypothetical protein
MKYNVSNELYYQLIIMVTLILFHLCGIWRTIRSIAWSLLIIWGLYASSAVLVHSPVNAASSTIIHDSLSALNVLQYHESYDHLFDGNNNAVFNVLKETYRNWDDTKSFSRFIEAFDSIDSSLWRTYKIDKSEVLTVLKSINIVLERSEVESLFDDLSSGTYASAIPYGYVVKTITKENGTLVTFKTDTKILPKRMNWHFWDGARYSCEREQCRRFNHLYKDAGTYTVDVYSSMRMHEGEKVSFQIDTRNGSRKSK